MAHTCDFAGSSIIIKIQAVCLSTPETCSGTDVSIMTPPATMEAEPKAERVTGYFMDKGS